jgi:UDP-2,3-diacylglucosamine pyrophosphatase LpxH
MRSLGVLLVLLTGATLTAASNRQTIIISDSHFGVGKQAGKWSPLEDFRWTAEFAAFLEYLRAPGLSTDLVLNGDTFELWQSLEDDCAHANKALGCTEPEALHRTRRVLTAHAADLALLRDFANANENRVYLVPGNHDAAILYPRVGKLVLSKIGARPGRIAIMQNGYWLSADGLIFAAHGHQMDANRYSKWPHPFRRVNNTTYLERPWGEQFVQGFFNRFEAKYPIIDNITGEGNAMRYGIAAEGLHTILDARAFLNFFLYDVTVEQQATALKVPSATDATGEWDLHAVRRQDSQFFVDAFAHDDPARRGVEAAAQRGLFRHAMHNLTDDDLRALCNERGALADAGAHVDPCPTPTLGTAVHAALTSEATRLLSFATDAYAHLQGEHPLFALVVLSHTHIPVDHGEVQNADGSWHPRIMNTGAWQRTITPERLEALRHERGLTRAATLRTVRLEELPACYSFIVVPPYPDFPAASLLFWTYADQRWGTAHACP